MLKYFSALAFIPLKKVYNKTMNEKDVNAAISNPQYFGNSIILFKNLNIPIAVKQFTYEGEYYGYDLIAINQHRCLLVKINGEEDYLRLLNFFTPMYTLPSKSEAINLIDRMNAKIVLTYIPQQVETVNRFDTFKQRNHKDPQFLEEQFRELRYMDYNRDAQYYIIRDKKVAEEFNMSTNDVGEVYVLKATSAYNAKESSFFCGKKEYCMTRIEPDPNIENADALKQQRVYTSISSLFAQSQEVAVQQLNLQKFLQRLTLISNDYVNYVQNKQQMDSQLLIYKQLGVEKLLVYHNDIDDKTINKLVNVKKSLNTEQQQKIGILCSDNIDLLQSYFGLVSNGFSWDMRLLDLNSKQESNLQFNCIQSTKSEYNNVYQNCKRYSYNENKITVNRLKQFLTQTHSEYYEKTNVRIPLENIPVSTGRSVKLSGNDLIYFYKPGCAACHTLNETLERITTQLLNPNPFRVKNIQNFKRINILKYNILNESELLPSPNQAPQLFALKDGQVKQADLLANRIDPSDDAKVYHFLTKFIDNL